MSDVPATLPPNERFAAFLASKSWTQAQAARELSAISPAKEAGGISAAFVSMILHGSKLPGRLVANTIENATASWAAGPIRTSEWDAVEIERKNARTGTDG